MEEDGKWVTINGAHVFVKNGQNLMDAFIRNKGADNQFEMYEKNKEMFGELFNKNWDTARTEFFKKIGLDGKPKILDEEEFNKIKDDKNPVMQRSTTNESYENLTKGQYRVSGLENSMYGTGIYFAYDEEDKAYYAGLANTQKVFEARVDKTAKMIDSRELDKIKDDIKNKLGSNKTQMDNIVLADNGVLAASLGYDGIYYDNVKYGLVMNRGKLIIKK